MHTDQRARDSNKNPDRMMPPGLGEVSGAGRVRLDIGKGGRAGRDIDDAVRPARFARLGDVHDRIAMGNPGSGRNWWTGSSA
ncbi:MULTISPECIES: hypothetical protein [Streptomyces]|uniref:hypothetical protein n=1 Tax=Streptomyces TaxID=1883 RepID=UPI0029B267AC|nr:hypothetical protein [Streptomyces sp. AK02-04a]MDX3762507.1 hypothetical protein [Streptomyces sp. AK02-04a]